MCSPRPHHRQDVGWTEQTAAGTAVAESMTTGQLAVGAQAAAATAVAARRTAARPVAQLGKGRSGSALE